MQDSNVKILHLLVGGGKNLWQILKGEESYHQEDRKFKISKLLNLRELIVHGLLDISIKK